MSYSRIKSLVNEELKSYFRPEFLNRLDEIIVFRQLTKKEVKQIADIMLRDVFKRGEEKGLKIEVTEKFKDRCVCVRAREAGRAPLNDGSSGVWLVGRRGLQQSLRTCHCGASLLQELTVMPVYPVCVCAARARVLLLFAAVALRLVDEGFNPAYGARPLRRAIMRLIEDCLAERILCGDIKEGDVVIMDVEPDGAIAVLAGDKKMRQVMDATPAGIS